MSANNTLLEFIATYIFQNGNKSITGNILQSVLNEVVNQIGQSQFLGIASTNDSPVGTDRPSFYLASAGYYSHFGTGLRITTPIGILLFNVS